jgi:hypothetical protein
MSSLAAAQADGYYRPPDWDGKSSLKKITGSKGACDMEEGFLGHSITANSSRMQGTINTRKVELSASSYRTTAGA